MRPQCVLLLHNYDSFAAYQQLKDLLAQQSSRALLVLAIKRKNIQKQISAKIVCIIDGHFGKTQTVFWQRPTITTVFVYSSILGQILVQ